MSGTIFIPAPPTEQRWLRDLAGQLQREFENESLKEVGSLLESLKRALAQGEDLLNASPGDLSVSQRAARGSLKNLEATYSERISEIARAQQMLNQFRATIQDALSLVSRDYLGRKVYAASLRNLQNQSAQTRKLLQSTANLEREIRFQLKCADLTGVETVIQLAPELNEKEIEVAYQTALNRGRVESLIDQMNALEKSWVEDPAGLEEIIKDLEAVKNTAGDVDSDFFEKAEKRVAKLQAGIVDAKCKFQQREDVIKSVLSALGNASQINIRQTPESARKAHPLKEVKIISDHPDSIEVSIPLRGDFEFHLVNRLQSDPKCEQIAVEISRCLGEDFSNENEGVESLPPQGGTGVAAQRTITEVEHLGAEESKDASDVGHNRRNLER